MRRGKLGLRLARRGIGPGADFERRLVWIFGSPRSGSTWLLQTLCALPDVVGINEPLIGSYLGAPLCDYRGIRIEELDVSNFTFERQRRSVRDQFFSEEFRDVWSPLLGKLIKARFLAHLARVAPEVPVSRATVIIKEPNGSQAADLILDALPRARALLLLRDGRDVVDSELAATVSGGWLSQEFQGIAPIEGPDRMEFVVRSASKWLWRTEVVQEAFRRHGPATLTVKYEDLRADPISTFGHLCRWLQLDIPEAMLRKTVEASAFERVPETDRGPDKFYRAAEPGLWRKNLSAQEQAAVHEVIGGKLRELGYEH